MKVAIINPPLLSQYSDFFSSGIPYFPIGAAYLAATLRSKGHEVTVIDAFGINPNRVYWHDKKSFVQGLTAEEIVEKIPADVDAVCFYASLVTSHPLNLANCRSFKQKFPFIPAIIFENSQQVYAYSLAEKLADFFSAGFDYVVTGEPEERVPKLLAEIEKKKEMSIEQSSMAQSQAPLALITVDGVAFRNGGRMKMNPKQGFIKDLDALPFPAFEYFPLQNYWNLRYSHGPFSGPYLPLLTSRGCPYGCRYCVVPATNQRLWRVRSPNNIVNELEYMGKQFGVTDFHWEDLNPTVNKRRIEEMCKLIVDKGLKVTWKFSAGTKIDTFDENTLNWMAKAGCVYVSFSPESGSPAVMKLMDKPFDHSHGIRMTKRMNEAGVRSQACFVLGFPGETDANLQETWTYLKELTKNGLDETSLFIMAPIPGASAAPQVPGYSPKKTDLGEITFSPEFRSDFKKLQKFRVWLYLHFFWWKLRYYPLKIFKSILNVLTRRFEIKTEMTIWRAFKTRILGKFGL